MVDSHFGWQIASIVVGDKGLFITYLTGCLSLYPFQTEVWIVQSFCCIGSSQFDILFRYCNFFAATLLDVADF